MKQRPIFISFTGADSDLHLSAMQALSSVYPIEWGILLDESQAGAALFPCESTLAKIKAAPGLRLAAHVCGEQASRIANAPKEASVCLAGFQRLQVNHGFSGSDAVQVENSVRFGRSRGLRTMLQTVDEFPADDRLDWLYDVSFGTGKSPGRWPAIPPSPPLCGYSGGINPENVMDVLESIAAPEGAQYWIDMESGIRTEGAFDISKCERICRAVYR